MSNIIWGAILYMAFCLDHRPRLPISKQLACASPRSSLTSPNIIFLRIEAVEVCYTENVSDSLEKSNILKLCFSRPYFSKSYFLKPNFYKPCFYQTYFLKPHFYKSSFLHPCFIRAWVVLVRRRLFAKPYFRKPHIGKLSFAKPYIRAAHFEKPLLRKFLTSKGLFLGNPLSSNSVSVYQLLFNPVSINTVPRVSDFWHLDFLEAFRVQFTKWLAS